ncbi:hypothetical protein PI95_032315 [Hassallia byssoidea VB512170]|uniref:Uncharacterized protein n=1 Tax=Hassallia byssoidea VB512170 TaxID=1304833 RepID=A0A846HJN7_9CYAN|nr:hypothetical protein [Hassalia byssoidea]NEU77059.1 hypothetical protein [Hassalia byssoidea VB512170]
MNINLVNSLFQVIQSLSQEERALLQEKMKKQEDWQTLRKQIVKLGEEINTYRQEKPFCPPVDEIIHQLREERDEQMSACFPELFVGTKSARERQANV